jgi:hypothetical protein
MKVKMKYINKTIYAVILAVSCFLCHAENKSLTNKIVTSTQEEFTRIQIEKSIDGIIELLKKEYIYPEKVQNIATQLKKMHRSRVNQYINNKSVFIREIGTLLRRTSQDGYIELLSANNRTYIGGDAEYQYQRQKSNFAFEEARVLEGNIGYLKINHFFQNKQAELVAERAFKLLNGTRAMIIDLREANEGSMVFAQYLMSYFIESKTLLCQMIYQRQEQQHEIWSISDIGHKTFKQDYPLFILTSSFVTSAAEFFSYTLKHLNRAVIVGEQTMGVAHWSQELKVNDWLMMKLPVAIPLNPITQSNWEGNGVIPDNKTDASSSFALALKLAKLSIY